MGRLMKEIRKVCGSLVRGGNAAVGGCVAFLSFALFELSSFAGQRVVVSQLPILSRQFANLDVSRSPVRSFGRGFLSPSPSSRLWWRQEVWIILQTALVKSESLQ